MSADTVGIALAGVLAWHPSSLDTVVQRPMLPLANRPWVEHFVERLQAGGVGRFAMCVNRLSDSLISLARREATSHGAFQLFVDGPPRGSAGCCRDVAQIMPASHYVIVESLVIPRLDVADLIRAHVAAGAVATIAIEDAEFDAEAALQSARPVGIHVAERDFLLSVPEIGYQDFKEVLVNRAVRGGARVNVYRSSVSNPRITDLSTYLDAQELLLRDQSAAPGSGPAARTASRGVSAADSPGAPDAQARVVGPALIGANSVVHDTASIIGSCVIGSNCLVGENAVVSDSTIWDNCVVGAEVVLSECVLAHGTVVGPRARRARELLLGTVSP